MVVYRIRRDSITASQILCAVSMSEWRANDNGICAENHDRWK